MNLLRRKTALGSKLKEAVADLTVDVFGYEKSVTQNILKHAEWYSDRLRIPRDKLHLRVFQHREGVRAFLHDGSRALILLNPKELAAFFMDISLITLDDSISNKVVLGVKTYLKEYSSKEHIPLEYLRIRIGIHNDEIRVQSYSYSTPLESIPLKKLIKYFKK